MTVRVHAGKLEILPHARARLRQRGGGMTETELCARVLEQLREGAYVLSSVDERVYVSVAGVSAVVRFDPAALIATIIELAEPAA